MRAVLRIAIVVLLAGLLLVTAFVAGFGVNYLAGRPQAASAGIPSNFELFWEAWGIIKGEYYGTIPTAQALTRGAIRGMLQGLGDPHTVLVEPEPAAVEQNNLQGQTGEVGLNLDVRNLLLTVISPVPNGPADKAGIRAGDIILKIGDKDILGDVTVQEANKLLRGPIGSKISVTVHHIGESQPATVNLIREKYALTSVDSKVLPNTTLGYVKVSMETAQTADEFAKALDSLKPQKITGLVLDLRNNPGGLFPDPVTEIAGQFLKNNDVVVYEKYRDGSEKNYKAGSKRGATDIKLVILVNGGTASDAEILAGALKDYKRAVLIGEPTYGKGTVQSVRQLSDGSAMHISVASWSTPMHNEIEGKGLQPDIAVPLTNEDVQQSIDPQLDRAIEYLQKGS